MIPIQLELTNFLSYRETTTLDFTNIHLACISGLNGAGKSSILDGITWALFGKSRSGSDDDLVNRRAQLNGDEAEVRIIFTIGGNLYRIDRRKKLRRSTRLEFQIAKHHDHHAPLDQVTWGALTLATTRETQAEIVRTLNMNYDTFVNASFFLQGRADEFTTKKASQRKEILADLLDLRHWDLYKERVKARVKETKLTLALKESLIADIDEELAKRTERELALTAANEQYNACDAELATAEQAYSHALDLTNRIREQQTTCQHLAAQLSQLQEDITHLTQQHGRRQQERSKLQATIDRAETIEKMYHAWTTADALYQTLQEQAEQHSALVQQCHPIKITIENTRSSFVEKQAQLEKRRHHVEKLRQERTNDLIEREQLQEQLGALGQQLASMETVNDTYQEARALLAQRRSERDALLRDKKRLESEAQSIANLTRNAQRAQRVLQTVQMELTQTEEALAQATEAAQQVAGLNAEIAAVDKAQRELMSHKKKLTDRAKRLKVEAGEQCPVCGQALTETHRAAVLAEWEAERQQLENQHETNASHRAERVQQLIHLTAESKKQESYKRQLNKLRENATAAKVTITEAERATAAWETSGAPQLTQISARLEENTAVLELETQVANLQSELDLKKSITRKHADTQRLYSKTEARLQENNKAITRWQNHEAPELAQVSRALSNDAFCPAERAALANLEQKIADLAYDSAAYNRAKQERTALTHAPKQYNDLQHALATKQLLDDQVAELAQQLATKRETAATQQTVVTNAQAKLATLRESAPNLDELDQQKDMLRNRRLDLKGKVHLAQQALNTLDHQVDKKEQLRAQHTQTTQHLRHLTMLEEACGQKGVQALLIERALPDIENYANQILERLTGGAMRVAMSTQRTAKTTKKAIETLDIHILDGAGKRPYENYSGGEQFRINFALRLALSRVLSKRAGVRLQTLVIDEGFGSQDPTGRQRLIEAINTIQNDFQRILVITHVDDLRDAFPTRIEVEKHTSGSRINVV